MRHMWWSVLEGSALYFCGKLLRNASWHPPTTNNHTASKVRSSKSNRTASSRSPASPFASILHHCSQLDNFIMTNSTQPPKASLLGLPRELRLQIYEYVLEFALDYNTSDFWRRHLGGPTLSSFRLPIAKLAMSCSSIAYEVRALICSLPDKDRFAIATLSVGPDGQGPMYLRRAPCPVADLKVFNIEVDVEVPMECFHCGFADCFNGALSTAYTLGARLGCSVRSEFDMNSALHGARALQKIQVHVRFLKDSWRTKDECEKLLQEFRSALETGADINCHMSAALSTKVGFHSALKDNGGRL